MTTLASAIQALLNDRKRYDANTLLTYAEKIDDLARFDAQWKNLDAQNTRLRTLGDALVAFYKRINDDASLVVTCKPRSTAAGG